MVAFSYVLTFLLNHNLQESPKYVDLSLPIFQDVFDITMTYRKDSEVPLRYGAFVDKTTQQEIKNEFLNYHEKNLFTTNLTTYNITELSKRTKGSNFTYHTDFLEGEVYLSHVHTSFPSVKIKILKMKKSAKRIFPA